MDGCFWHGCPIHGTIPKTNTEWWQGKIARTVARDRETNEMLRRHGWTVIRVWEHERVEEAAEKICAAVLNREEA